MFKSVVDLLLKTAAQLDSNQKWCKVQFFSSSVPSACFFPACVFVILSYSVLDKSSVEIYSTLSHIIYLS